MRFFLVLIIWIAFVGGVSLYVAKREAVQPVAEPKVAPAGSNFALEVTTSFDVAPDPFALEETDPAGIVIRGGGRDLARRDRLEAGTTLRIEPVPGLIEGRNELYVEASPPLSEANRPHALRVRVLRGGAVVAERIVWAEPGSRVASTLVFDTTGGDSAREH